jgi:hypothetical protein
MTRRSVSARGLLVVLVPFELLILYVVLRNSSWVYDDNFFLALAGQEGFTWHWLSSVQFEHWDIAEHAVISLQHAIFYFDYRWALIAMLLVLGASAYLLERVLATFVHNRLVTVALALWFALNILWVRPLQWWAAGVQYLPYTFFELLCLYGFLRYHADRAVRWLVISAGALAGGLLFYEKPAYMLLYLALLQILLMCRDLRPRQVLTSFWRDRAIWLAYVVIIAIWAIGYIHSHAYGGSVGSVTVGQYASYFRILWLQTLVPSLASVTIPGSGLDALQIAFVVVSQLVVAAGLALSLRRKRSAWRAWAFLGVIILANGALVARSRISQFGVEIANDPRYLVEYAWIVPLAVCAAFSRDVVLPSSAAEQADLARGRIAVADSLHCRLGRLCRGPAEQMGRPGRSQMGRQHPPRDRLARAIRTAPGRCRQHDAVRDHGGIRRALQPSLTGAADVRRSGPGRRPTRRSTGANRK